MFAKELHHKCFTNPFIPIFSSYRSHSKMTVPKNRLLLNPSPILTLAVTCTSIPLPSLSPTKSDMQINHPRKCILSSMSFVFTTQNPIYDFHFRTFKSKNIVDMYFMTSIKHQMQCQL